MELRRYPFPAMGSPCELRLYAEDRATSDEVAAEALSEVTRLEAKYSRYRDDSLASAINRSAGDPRGIDVDAETAALLDYAQVCFERSDGLFDITSGILRRVWNFRSGVLPSREAVAEVLEHVGWSRVEWHRPRLVLPDPEMQLDFGGYVKEYAADRVAEQCRRAGVGHGLVDLGGDLSVIGPHPDGKPWGVGIRDPRQPQAALATIPLEVGGLASSGDYERCMVVDGRRYGHILDPRSGWPVGGLLSVSVAADSCLIAGTISTIAMLRGEAGGTRWLAEQGLPCLWMDRGHRVGGSVEAPTA